MVVLYRKDLLNHSTRKRKLGCTLWLTKRVWKPFKLCPCQRLLRHSWAGWASEGLFAALLPREGRSAEQAPPSACPGHSCTLSRQELRPRFTLNTSVLLLHTSHFIISRAIHPAMHYCTSRTAPAPPDHCPAEFLGIDLGVVMPNQSAAGVLLIS